MTPAEVDDFLAACRHLVVGAIDADGWPTGTIAASRYVAGALRLRFAPHDPLADRLLDDPHVCCLADTHASYHEIRGVIVHGRAQPTAGHDGEVGVAVDRVVSFDFGRLRAARPT